MIWVVGIALASARRANPLGNFQPCVLRTLAPGARLHLGLRVGVSAAVICAGVSVEIGEGTILGAGAMVLDNDFHVPADGWDWATESRVKARPVRIGRGVFIGARAIVLKGVTIGDRAVVGAGAVVTHDIDSHTIVAGNPARAVRRTGGLSHEPRSN
jgi:acetyltransferase-like isoleucine patch superfamily enzyme